MRVSFDDIAVHGIVDRLSFELREKPECKDMAADWFHKKWGVPKETYLECMTALSCD